MAKSPALKAKAVDVQSKWLRITTSDGKQLAAPISEFPRLKRASTQERRRWRLVHGGAAIRWDDLDEDVLVDSLLPDAIRATLDAADNVLLLPVAHGAVRSRAVRSNPHSGRGSVSPGRRSARGRDAGLAVRRPA
jgi:hypothetical protein